MSDADSKLPEDVAAALRRGSLIEGIKLLRQARGLGLKEAKDIIDAHLRGKPAAAIPTPTAGPLPRPVADALQRGNKIDAIRLLRQHTGMGLKEAKNAVDAAHQPATRRAGGLSPGEVPPSRGGVWWIVVIALAAAGGYYLLRGS